MRRAAGRSARAARRSRRGAPACAGALPLLLPAWLATLAALVPAAPAHGAPPGAVAAVEVEALPAREASPGSYLTLSVRLRNGSGETVETELVVTPPPGWSAVTGRRTVTVDPGTSPTIPFTLWVPPFAGADSLHETTVRALSGSGTLLDEATFRVAVRTVSAVQVDADRAMVTAPPGSDVKHLFRVRNTGNRTATFTLRVKSIPDWQVRLAARSIRMAPGEDRFVETELSIPGDAPVGTSHLLNLTVRAAVAAGDAPGAEEKMASVTTLVDESSDGSIYRRLPVTARLSVTGREDEEASYGMRAATRGALSGDLSVDLDADVVASPGDRGGNSRWESQSVRGGVSGNRWELYGGDVRITLPDVSGRSITGRGGRARLTAPGADVELFGATERSRRAGNAWAAVLRRTAGPGGAWRGVQADWLRRTYRGGASLREGRRDLYTLTTTFAPASHTTVKLETGWGRLAGEEEIETGRAAEVELEHRGEILSTTTRVWAGSALYPGVNRDRDGFTAYSRCAPRRSAIFWLSADGSRGRATPDPDSHPLTTTTLRAGGRYSPRRGPRFELSAGRLADREGFDGELRDSGEEDLVVSAWLPVRRFLFGASRRTGRGWNDNTGEDGPIGEWGASLSGAMGRMRGSFRWTRGEEWRTGGGGMSAAESYFADLCWTSRSGFSQIGLSAESDRYGAADMLPPATLTVRPRIDWRLTKRLGLRTELSLRSEDDAFRTERWECVIRWSDKEAIPVFWDPVRGEVLVTVYLDDDLDGEPDPGEAGAAGVEIGLDGDRRFTDASGRTSWQGLDPGEPLITVNVATLPAGYTTSTPLPFTVRIEPGEPVSVEIALAPDCTARGLFFIDENHDGRPGPGERGAGDIRLVLVRRGTVIADCLTRPDGRYEFRHAPPGGAEIRVADGWLPRGWLYTEASAVSCRLRPGDACEVPPLGVATKRRPIVKTFSSVRTGD